MRGQKVYLDMSPEEHSPEARPQTQAISPLHRYMRLIELSTLTFAVL